MSKLYGMTVRNAPVGLLLLGDGTLLFKSEYHRDSKSEPDAEPDVYIVESGERYCDSADVACINVTDDAIELVRDAWKLT